MGCAKCGHTVQNLGLTDTGGRTFWCPRCGTLKTETHHMGRTFEANESPALVERVRGLVLMIDGTDAGRWLKSQVEVSGVLESTHTPGERQ